MMRTMMIKFVILNVVNVLEIFVGVSELGSLVFSVALIILIKKYLKCLNYKCVK